jgi:hypothetical protein
MTTITLPPLPHLPLGGRILRAQITEIIKARDLEVARVVLEGAEQVADACTAARIRNIEVKHE